MIKYTNIVWPAKCPLTHIFSRANFVATTAKCLCRYNTIIQSTHKFTLTTNKSRLSDNSWPHKSMQKEREREKDTEKRIPVCSLSLYFIHTLCSTFYGIQMEILSQLSDQHKVWGQFLFTYFPIEFFIGQI